MRSAANDVKRKTASLVAFTEGSGRLYRVGRGASYRASSAGNPPVRLSGALRDSLKTYVFDDGAGFAVRARQFYSLFLEAGAKGGGNFGNRRGTARPHNRRQRTGGSRVLEPRPFLDRVMQEQASALDQRVGRALREGLKWRETKL
jgi:hypothetical protein